MLFHRALLFQAIIIFRRGVYQRSSTQYALRRSHGQNPVHSLRRTPQRKERTHYLEGPGDLRLMSFTGFQEVNQRLTSARKLALSEYL
jgi:hypothetical protein